MKNWTIEELTELWQYRGYNKKKALKMAEIEFNKMRRRKSADEQHELMQEMLYN